MKKLLALALVVMMAGGALAQGAGMGIFFDPAVFTDANSNLDPAAGTPFNAYLVLLGSPFDTIGGYECSVAISDATVFVLTLTGPNGWTNFGGSNLNHLCGYQQALSTPAGGTVLSTFNMIFSGANEVTMSIGAATPPSIPGVPVIANGANPEELLGCGLTSGSTVPDVVATLNGAGIVATESHTLTDVKALFD